MELASDDADDTDAEADKLAATELATEAETLWLVESESALATDAEAD